MGCAVATPAHIYDLKQLQSSKLLVLDRKFSASSREHYACVCMRPFRWFLSKVANTTSSAQIQYEFTYLWYPNSPWKCSFFLLSPYNSECALPWGRRFISALQSTCGTLCDSPTLLLRSRIRQIRFFCFSKTK